MTTEPQTDLNAELTQLEVDAKTLGSAVTNAKITAQTKITELDANRDAWRKEAWAWRKLTAQVQTLTPMTPEEVAAKK